MPVSKNALIRYKTIDNCLRNRYRKWTLEDLMEACSEALYEYEGVDKGISRRTIQNDIYIMRSEKLGYNAPIIVRDHKYYEYEDPGYSITDTPLSPQDMELMGNAVAILKQLSGFSAFSGMEDIVGKLEDHVSAVKHEKEPVIFYESNNSLKGLHFIPTLYEAICAKRPIIITYQSFKAREAHDFIFSPYVLKEYRNRWFVFGHRRGEKMLFNLALDRIKNIIPAKSDEKYIKDSGFDPKTYFDDMVGVTKNPTDKKAIVRFSANPLNSPYIETKPIHGSQMVVERREDGSTIFQIEVVINYELERELISYGHNIKVLSPANLVKRVSNSLRAAADQYRD